MAGGIARSNKPEATRSTPGLRTWEDLVSYHRVRGRPGGWLAPGWSGGA